MFSVEEAKAALEELQKEFKLDRTFDIADLGGAPYLREGGMLFHQIRSKESLRSRFISLAETPATRKLIFGRYDDGSITVKPVYRLVTFTGRTQDEALHRMLLGMCGLARDGGFNPHDPYAEGVGTLAHVRAIIEERIEVLTQFARMAALESDRCRYEAYRDRLFMALNGLAGLEDMKL